MDAPGPDQVVPFDGRAPRLGPDVYLAPGSRVVGDVVLGRRVSIWFNAVLRGDLAPVRVGDGSNVQDNCTLHVDDEEPCLVGRDVVVGHGAILHGCTVEDACLIGMGSVVLNGARIGRGSVVGAGAVVPQRRVIPPGHLVLGVGAGIVRPLPEGFWESETFGDSKYRRLAETYRRGHGWRWPDADWDERDAAEVAARPAAGDAAPKGPAPSAPGESRS
jgi:carbonic anhydrase/acetyltransferase-like protein (isoleucine patch superfamily)